MRNALAVTLVFLIGCTDSGNSDDGTTPTTSWTTPEPEPVDTGWPAGDLANFMIAHHGNTNTTRVYAVATESSPGFVNLAECAVEGKACLTSLPGDEDDYEDIDTDRELDREIVKTRFLGYEIEFGPYTMSYREDPETGFGFYYKDVSAEELAEGWIGPSWDGQWDEYSSTKDLEVSAPIELIFPRTGGHIEFTNGEFVPFEWVPNGEGLVTLVASSKFGFDRMYLLEDDGYFELDVDSLGITDDLEDITFKFIRWNMTTLRKFGHVVDLVATSDAYFTASYINIGAREYLYAADRCGEAGGIDALQGGGWWGKLGDYGNDLDPADDCLGGQFSADANGNDAIHRVEVEARSLLTVDYNVYEESASVYLVTDCDDANTCFTGADYDDQPNVHEFINYFNPSDDTRTVYLVADSTNSSDSVYTLDVTLNPLFPPDVVDTCAEAEAAYPMPPGSYYGEFTAFTDGLNPGVGGCTGASSPGPDSMVPIEVPAATTVTITINMPGADPVLYLLYNCNDAFSCPVGSDLSLSAQEVLTYTAGATSEIVYLVVDSKSGQTPYFLSISY